MMMGKFATVTALVGVTVALLASTTPAGAQTTCSNDLPGLQATVNGTGVCCSVGCGSCGGSGCDPGANSTLTAANCCTENIVAAGDLCSVTEAAPCIIDVAAANESSVCINGQQGVQDPNTDVCCPLECGDACGGVGCGRISGVEADQCCSNLIFQSGRECSDSVEPPCAVVASSDSNSTCSNGLAGIEDTANLICCDAGCGQCGGDGCGDVSGLTADECCSASITETGQLCSVTNAAPCVVDPPEVVDSTCQNGLAGVEDGSVCCAVECNGQCGGVGCGSIAGTNGASDCCSATILQSNVTCDPGVQAPCVMVAGSFTNAPVAAPTIPPPSAAPTAGSRDLDFTSAPTAAGGAASSASPTAAGSAAGTGAGTTAGTAGGSTAAGGTTPAPTMTTPPPSAAGSGDVTFAPGDTNKDGTEDANDGVDTNGDGVIDENDGVDTNGDGVIDSADGATTVPGETPAPVAGADADAAGNGAMSAAKLPAGSVYAGVVGVAAFVGGMLVL